jgi:LuxR family maltose regulon positive regulatory protein
MAYAWGLLNSGELEMVEPRLRVVEELLQRTEGANGNATSLSAGVVISDEERFRSLHSELEAARVYLAQSLGVIPGTLASARRALELIPPDDGVGRATGIALVALAHWGQGDLDDAHHTFSDALDAMRENGHLHAVIRGIFVLGDIRVAQGRLRDAVQTYEHGLRYSAQQVHTAPPETDELHLGLAEIHRERNDLAAASSYLDDIVQSAKHTVHIGNRLRWCSAMASILAARGAFDEALTLLEDGERHERRDPLPRVRPVDAIKARIHVAQGRVAEARDWAGKRQVTVDDELSYLREYEHITLARLLIAKHGADDQRSLEDADQLLVRLRTAAQSGGRMGSVIETLVLQAMTRHKLGNLRSALDLLGEAVMLAEPEQYLRTFLDEGVAMRELLRHAIARGLASSYTRHVLSTFDKPVHVAPAGAVNANTATNAIAPEQVLTTRETEILRLISTGMRNQEIADHLDISGATVKRHIANAYGKLGASHRTEALLRANELKLL